MGLENRDYYRDEQPSSFDSGIPGLRFDRQSIVVTLIVINVLVFLADTFSPELTQYDMLYSKPADGSIPEVELEDGLRIPSDQIGVGQRWLAYLLALKSNALWQVWAYLTHGFAHASLSSDIGIMHLLGNMLTLFFLGRPVEERMGRSEFLRFYLLAILIGGLAWLLFELATGGYGYCVGASGAVSAVTIYFVFMAPHARLFLFGVVPVSAWMVGILFLVMNLGYALSHASIAWQAHLAGGALGWLYFKYQSRLNGLQLPQRSRLRIHQPAGEIDQQLQQEADRILAKISQQGEASLTRKERKTLKRYSEKIRNRRQS